MKTTLKTSIFIVFLCSFSYAQLPPYAVEMQKKADNGDVESQYSLANHYYEGKYNVPRDRKLALHYYRLAAEAGHTWAQSRLAKMYMDGIGVQSNQNQAKYWYTIAAKHGAPGAQISLADLYVEKEETNFNINQAAKWYKEAANNGWARAQKMLGMFYFAGHGVSQDYVRAYAWLNLAGTRTPGVIAIRDEVKKLLTPDQLADAQTMTRELEQSTAANYEASSKARIIPGK